jgi:hypothetical protein
MISHSTKGKTMLKTSNEKLVTKYTSDLTVLGKTHLGCPVVGLLKLNILPFGKYSAAYSEYKIGQRNGYFFKDFQGEYVISDCGEVVTFEELGFLEVSNPTNELQFHLKSRERFISDLLPLKMS